MSAALPNLVESAFNVLVRRARWMGLIPVLPPLADALAQAAMALGDPGRHRAMTALERDVTSWPEVSTGLHRFGGVEFRRHHREFAHLHGCGLLDLRVGLGLARSLVSAGRAEPHHVLGECSWISFWLRRECQVPDALQMLRLAWDAAPADPAAPARVADEGTRRTQ